MIPVTATRGYGKQKPASIGHFIIYVIFIFSQ